MLDRIGQFPLTPNGRGLVVACLGGVAAGIFGFGGRTLMSRTATMDRPRRRSGVENATRPRPGAPSIRVVALDSGEVTQRTPPAPGVKRGGASELA